MAIVNNDKIITPQGASLIFGKTLDNEHLNVVEVNQNTYIPYTITIDEEVENETPLTSSDIIYDNNNSELEAENAQNAIDELKAYIDEKTNDIFIATYNVTPFQELLDNFNKNASIWLQLVYDNGSSLQIPLGL